MNTKQKLISHVDHIFNQNLKSTELERKIESLTLMADWSRKQKKISNEDYDEIIKKIEIRKETPKEKEQVKAKKKILNRNTIIILILIVLLFSAGLFFIVKSKKKVSLINSSQVKKEGRALRFQGKLIDSAGNPIDHKVDVVFHLYSQKNDGKPIYTGTCMGEHGIVPGMDGSFNVNIGTDCNMSRISDQIFSKTPGLYLGVQVGNDKELSPRYPIATVQYASNSDNVKGLTLGTNESSIPYIDEEGRLVIGAVSPKLKSTQGDFSIEGQTVSITTNEETGGSINLSPAEGGNILLSSGNVGIGKADPESKLDVAGSIALSEDILLNGQNTAIYQNQGGGIRFYTSQEITDLTSPALLLASENKIGLATNKIVDTISAGGSMSPTENEKFDLGSETNKWQTIYTKELIMADQGIGAFWQRKDDVLSPAKQADDIVLGSQSEQNALIKLSGKLKGTSWINSGSLGIGTSTPHQLISALGKADNNSLSSITNLSKNDTPATNVLRLNLGTAVAGTSSRFIDFYANSTNDNNGTKVGSIKLQNGAVVYQTNGADFAEYVEIQEKTDEGDIISITSQGNKKATKENGVLMGVVSNSAGFIGNAKDSEYGNKTLVGLIGQIKTNISTINGPVTPGDHIRASTMAGFGERADSSGEVIGTVIDSQKNIDISLKASNCPQGSEGGLICGKVMIFVSPKYVEIATKHTKKDLLKGTGVIPTNKESIRVYNNNITDESIILLTSISTTPTGVSIVEQESCEDNKKNTCRPYFSVIADKNNNVNLKFNWLIIDK